MKLLKKITLWTGLISCLLGATLALIGYGQGGLQELENSNTEPYTLVTKDFDNIDKITIDSANYDLVIKSSDTDKVTVRYYQKAEHPLNITVKEKQLNLSDTQLIRNQTTHVGLFTFKDFVNLRTLGSDYNLYTIVITLPKGQTLKNLSATLDTGDLELADTSILTSDIRLNAGDLTANETHFNNSQIELAVGDINLSEVTFTDHNTIDTATGDTQITLKNYNLTVTTNENLSDSDITSALKKSEENSLDIASNLGDISIQ